MAACSSILAWEIPWTEKLGSLQSRGLQRVGQDLVTKQQLRTAVKRILSGVWEMSAFTLVHRLPLVLCNSCSDFMVFIFPIHFLDGM